MSNAQAVQLRRLRPCYSAQKSLPTNCSAQVLCSRAEGAVPSCSLDAVDSHVLHHGRFKNTNASRPYRFSSAIMLLVLMFGRT
ncbi:hypothetical protein VPH35_032252 [Triticum aestivum]